MALSTYLPPAQGAGEGESGALPPMAVTAVYWQVCRVLVLLAAAAPASFGAVVYREVATVANLIRMLVKNRFEVEPADAGAWRLCVPLSR